MAAICVLLLLAPMASAQGPGIQTSGAGWRSGLLRDYKYQELAPIDLANSGRLEALLRSGNIYLSLADAIALALENNLDIAYQRYGALNASANCCVPRPADCCAACPTACRRRPPTRWPSPG